MWYSDNIRIMEWLGIIAALASAASWAFGTVIFERIGKVMPYAGITFFKSLFSVILMFLLVVTIGDFKTITIHDVIILVVSGIIGIAIGDTLFFRSLQDLGAKVQVLYFMLGQVVTMFLSFMLLGDVLSLEEYIGATILLSGIVVVTWGKQEDHPNKTRGIIGGFLSILCFSVSTIMIKYTEEQIDVISASFYRMLAGTVMMMMVGTTTHSINSWLESLKSKRILMLFLLNVFVITVGGFILSMYAIKNISVSLASILSTTEPVFVLLLALLINHEKVSQRELAGAFITIIGLLIIILYE